MAKKKKLTGAFSPGKGSGKRGGLSPKFVAHQFKPGQSGNPKGLPPGTYRPKEALRKAIENLERQGIDVVDKFVKAAVRSKQLMPVLMHKLLPNKQEISLAPDQLNKFAAQVGLILARYIADPTKLQQALAELESLHQDESDTI